MNLKDYNRSFKLQNQLREITLRKIIIMDNTMDDLIQVTETLDINQERSKSNITVGRMALGIPAGTVKTLQRVTSRRPLLRTEWGGIITDVGPAGQEDSTIIISPGNRRIIKTPPPTKTDTYTDQSPSLKTSHNNSLSLHINTLSNGPVMTPSLP